MPETIDNVSFAEFLNPAAKKDDFFLSAAQGLDPSLAEIRKLIANNVILANLDNQSESTLDFLARYHFNVDVYDTSFTFSQKLALLKQSIYDKTLRGTPFAVKKTLSIAFQSAKVVEWFNDSPPGPPNTFRIIINDPLVDPARVQKMIDTIIKIKNARSWFAGIFSYDYAPTDTLYMGGAVAEYDHITLPYTPTIL
jgi:phage tail P2-like protein